MQVKIIIQILDLSPFLYPQVGRIRKTAARKREYHILFMVVTTAACYLVCWMPYGVVAMMATFGPPNIISPVASVVPSLLAKSSTVINPLIYILMNKQVSQWKPKTTASNINYIHIQYLEAFPPLDQNRYYGGTVQTSATEGALKSGSWGSQWIRTEVTVQTVAGVL